MTIKDYIANLPVLETERLILRRFEMKDAESYAECFEDPKVYTYWGHGIRKGDSFERVQRNINEMREMTWAIIDKNTGEAMGDIVAFNFDGSRQSGKIISELGYRIAVRHWNKGIMTEAVKAVVDFLFDNTTIERIYATVMTENIGSIRVLEKNGFVCEGVIHHGKLLETICDYCIMANVRLKNNETGDTQ